MRTVAVLAFPGVQSLDLSGPLDVFAEANRFLLPEAHYRLEVIGTERGTMPCSNGMPIQAHRHYSEAESSYDLLLVAGGPALVREGLGDAVHGWLRGIGPRCRRFGSICNGALELARAGMLKGRRVSTHWNDVALLASISPSARIQADRLFVRDGELYTSAGVTAGIDLSLYLLAQDHGADVALNVAKRLVVFTQRSGGQSQFSPYLVAHLEPASPIGQVQQYVFEHLGEELSIAVLAEVARMSARNFSRVFVRVTGATPADFVERARIDAARAMLENSAVPLKTVAYRCGLTDSHQLRAAFRRRLGVTPRQYRLQFSQPLVSADGRDA